MRDIKVVIYSIIALGFVALSFTINWLFLIPAAVLSWMSYKRLTKNN